MHRILELGNKYRNVSKNYNFNVRLDLIKSNEDFTPKSVNKFSERGYFVRYH